MNRTKELIENRILNFENRNVFTRKDFQDITTSGSIGQSLSRLVKQGQLRRIGRGMFCLQKTSSLLGVSLNPDINQAAEAIARKFRWSILPYGALAANRLGLSQQVPAKIIYLSDGPTKEVQIEKQTIYFKHTRPKEMCAENYTLGLIVQALKYLGKDHVDENTTTYLKQKLSRAEKDELLKHIKYSTEWIFKTVQKIAKD